VEELLKMESSCMLTIFFRSQKAEWLRLKMVELCAMNAISARVRALKERTQHRVYLTLGQRTHPNHNQPVCFTWSDGFAVPAPAQVTQTVRRHLASRKKRKTWAIQLGSLAI